jgi:hypothetical protein
VTDALNGFAVGDWVVITPTENSDSVILKARAGELGCITKIAEGDLYPYAVHFNDGAETGFNAEEMRHQDSSESYLFAHKVDIRIEELADWEKEILEEAAQETDVVNHPSHYADGWSNGAEVIDITENLNFNRGNAVKYIARAGKKDQDREVEDLKKAQFYINREIARLESIN